MGPGAALTSQVARARATRASASAGSAVSHGGGTSFGHSMRPLCDIERPWKHRRQYIQYTHLVVTATTAAVVLVSPAHAHGPRILHRIPQLAETTYLRRHSAAAREITVAPSCAVTAQTSPILPLSTAGGPTSQPRRLVPTSHIRRSNRSDVPAVDAPEIIHILSQL